MAAAFDIPMTIPEMVDQAEGPYEASLVALVAATEGNADLCKKALSKITATENPFINAWFAGRSLMANALLMSHRSVDPAQAYFLLNALTISLDKQLTDLAKKIHGDPSPVESYDPFFLAWAYGYFYKSAPTEITETTPAFLETLLNEAWNRVLAADGLQGRPGKPCFDDFIWVAVMFYQLNRDIAERVCIQAQEKFREQGLSYSSFAAAVNALPPGDYQAWALNIILHTEGTRPEVKESAQVYLNHALRLSKPEGVSDVKWAANLYLGNRC